MAGFRFCQSVRSEAAAGYKPVLVGAPIAKGRAVGVWFRTRLQHQCSCQFQGFERRIFCIRFVILKNPDCLSLQESKLLIQLVAVIGGSEISKVTLVSEVKQAAWVGRGCRWGGTLFLFSTVMAFGGVAGNWFDAQHAGGGMAYRILQLATGSVAMGAIVSIPGSLFFGRNPIRWGMGMPILVYLGGILAALLAGRSGVSGLIYGAPFLIGLAIAAGVTGAFLVDGIFVRLSPAGDAPRRS